jgi:murein tripeptide amidase MpaA
MTYAINAAFDSGNIRLLRTTNNGCELEIIPDRESEFYQWFHFRLTGAAGRTLTLRIVNAGGSAYPDGWLNYQARISDDRQSWRQTPTSYADGVLSITVTPPTDNLWLAYFAPYSIERHHDLIARMSSTGQARYRLLGRSIEGQPIDCLSFGDGPKQVWLFCRQHPGETMAAWWGEGALEALANPHNAVARALKAAATIHVIPNMNPDGSCRGHLRTNYAGVNLNREWHSPSDTRSPEVLAALGAMQQTGVDFAIDVHGDETIPHVFLAGFEGIPNWRDEQGAAFYRDRDTLAQRTPDFQTKYGYPASSAGKANLSIATDQLANRFGAVAMTLEMPFKDHVDCPDPVQGWSPERSKLLAADCLAVLAETIA